jgi:hypothetical protein
MSPSSELLWNGTYHACAGPHVLTYLQLHYTAVRNFRCCTPLSMLPGCLFLQAPQQKLPHSRSPTSLLPGSSCCAFVAACTARSSVCSPCKALALLNQPFTQLQESRRVGVGANVGGRVAGWVGRRVGVNGWVRMGGWEGGWVGGLEHWMDGWVSNIVCMRCG